MHGFFTFFVQKLPGFALLLGCLLMVGCQGGGHSGKQQEPPNTQEVPADEAEMHPLFDGSSFRGWEGEMTFFRIEDSAIVAGSMQRDIPTNKFLCTEKTYGDFELSMKVKFPTRNNNGGIQIRSKRIPNHHEVVGYQIDVGYDRGKALWASIYDESRRNKFIAEAPADRIAQLLKPEDYNHYRIRAEHNRIQVWFNGELVVDYTEEDPAIEPSGVICVQIHSGPPSEAWYRDIQI
ncbi:MAG: DUF1080 domain-containing protein, partial [Bacteroidetes bacterium]